MSGTIISASQNADAGGAAQARLTDMTQGGCGHTGKIVTASPTVYANGRGKARVGSFVTGCNIGVVVTGEVKKEIGSGAATSISTKITFQGEVIEFTEVDYGNLDDDEDTDDGLNIFPGTDNPTPQQQARSDELDVSPTTEVAEDSTASNTNTPTITCTDIGDVADPDYQLSTNYQLKELSTEAVISHYYVREQHGLSVSDIVCNLQAVAQFILEPLVLAYGKSNFIITSAFRHGSSTSQHERGQAVDIQFPLYTNQQVYDVAVTMKNTFDFDQLILEYGGNRPWIHCSFNRAGNRVDGTYNKFGTRVSPGNYVWGTIKYMT
jgi:uncharacterized Zn-binding protein involved in type VI secretion/uncharacterized protein YcbK (DUF882 family)